MMFLPQAYPSLSILELVRTHPFVKFVHTFPGLVKTDVSRNLLWYWRRIVGGIIKLIGSYPEVSGDAHLYASLVSAMESSGGGFRFLYSRIDKVYDQDLWEKGKDLFDTKIQYKVWDHTQETFGKAFGKAVNL